MELENLQVKISVDQSQVKTGVKKAQTEFEKLEDSWKIINEQIESAFGSIKKIYGLNNNQSLINTDGINQANQGILDLRQALEDMEGSSQLKDEITGLTSALAQAEEKYNDLLQKQALVEGNEARRLLLELDTWKQRVDFLTESLNTDLGKLNAINQVSASQGNGSAGLNGIAGKIGMAVLGIQGIFSAIRKITSQNENLTNGINNLFATLGNVFEPLLNSLANIINFISTLISKIFKVSLGSKNANEETAKNTASFDEIHNIGTTNSESTSATAVNWGDLSGIEKVLTLLAGGTAIAGVINLIRKLSELKTVFSGIIDAVKVFFAGATWKTFAGIGVILVGVVELIVDIIDMIKDPSWKEFGEILQDVGIILVGVALAIGSVPVAIAAAIALVVGVIVANWEKIKNFFVNAWSNFQTWRKNLDTKITTWLNDKITAVSDFFTNLSNKIKNKFNEMKTAWNALVSALGTSLKSEWQGIKDKFSAAKQWVSDLFTKIGDTIKTKFKNIVNNYIISPINKVVDWVNTKLNFSYSGLYIKGKQIIPAFNTQLFTLKNIPSLNVGTNYVAAEGLAYLHQGEAVVPKAYNGRTEELLEQLIGVVQSKEFKAYISQKEIGKSAVSYINSQSRIMGGAIV